MALVWVMLGNLAAMEAVMLLVLPAPGLDVLHRVLSSFTRGLLKPLLSVVPLCLFLLLDIHWKYETRPSCELESWCPPTVRLRDQKSVLKSQRNAFLIGTALAFYWLLYSVAHMVVKIEQLNQLLARLKDRDSRAVCGGIRKQTKWRLRG
ncbi:hypothetical protein EUGRSUZ_G02113 [Eucalyptus grandis]|uniref:Endoplasmic reticulum transmembrane protein n=2 Tax=Eucalyptus grandis TaxID=71139 RepID=A0A059BF68_EUCGR|nr:hypothetical protein EUGRSUZ_G02113 [Eucalyptus grandis]